MKQYENVMEESDEEEDECNDSKKDDSFNIEKLKEIYDQVINNENIS